MRFLVDLPIGYVHKISVKYSIGMSRSIRRVRRNTALPEQDPYFLVDPDYEGFQRRTARPTRNIPDIINPTLAQRVASIEAELSEINADQMNLNQRVSQLEGGGFGGPQLPFDQGYGGQQPFAGGYGGVPPFAGGYGGVPPFAGGYPPYGGGCGPYGGGFGGCPPPCPPFGGGCGPCIPPPCGFGGPGCGPCGGGGSCDRGGHGGCDRDRDHDRDDRPCDKKKGGDCGCGCGGKKKRS